MESRMGKAAGGMGEQLGGWKSTRKDGKAAGGDGRAARKTEKQLGVGEVGGRAAGKMEK